MSTLQRLAQKMLDSDIDQGHANPDSPWGRYEVLARVCVEDLKDNLPGASCRLALASILEGKS